MGWALSFLVQDARAERPYVIGGKNDPALQSNRDGSEDRGKLDLRVELLRSHRYDPRYAPSRVNVAPGGQALAAIGRLSQSGPVAWSLGSGQRLQLPRVQGSPRQLAFDYGMRRLAVATAEGNAGEGGISLYDLETGELLQQLQVPSEPQDLAFSPDGGVIVAATRSGVFAWNLDQRRDSADQLTNRPSDSVVFSTSDRLLIAGQSGAVLQVFSFSEGRVVEAPDGKDGGPSAWSPDGRYLVIAQRSGLRIVGLQEGLSQDVPSEQEVVSVDWGASGNVIVAGTADGEVLVYLVDGVAGANTEGGTERRTEGGTERRTEGGTALHSDEHGRTEERRADSRRGSVSQGPRKKRSPPPKKEEDVTIESSYQVLILKQFDADPREGRDLERRLREKGRKLEGCWNKELRQGKAATGRLEVTMGVTPEGEGRGFSEVVEDGLKNDRLTDCIEDKLRGALFPPGLDDLEIHLTIELKAVVVP